MKPRVAAVILSSREAPAVLLGAAAAAASDPALQDGVLDVLVNGNRALAEVCAGRLGNLAPAGGPLLRLWFLPLGDKSHAWNTYVHRLWPGADCTVFIDGYVRTAAGALGLLAQGLAATPEALAVTGVPSVGHSAAKLRQAMVSGGGIHGNLYGLGRVAMELVREQGFRLPLGLYRTDPLLGAALLFRLAPDTEDWDTRRIKVVAEATWQFDPLRWWRVADLMTQGRRLLRQRQGLLENLAFRHHFCELKARPAAMPATTAQLVDGWIAACPDAARNALRWRPLVGRALRRLRAPRDWSAAAAPAQLLWQSGAGHAAADSVQPGALAPLPNR